MRFMALVLICLMGSSSFAMDVAPAKTKTAYCQVTKDGHFFGVLPHPDFPTAKITFKFEVDQLRRDVTATGYYGWGKFEVPSSDLEIGVIGHVRELRSPFANYIRIDVTDKAKGMTIQKRTCAFGTNGCLNGSSCEPNGAEHGLASSESVPDQNRRDH